MIYLDMIKLPSSLSGQQLHILIWKPEQPVGVVQLVHGMAEHIARYDEFARHLCTQGYAVIGHSHLGHGLSVNKPDDLGYFGKKDGWKHLTEDVHLVRQEAQQRFPGLPHFILGHSMGSFVLRTYVTLPQAAGIAGAIFSGTGHMPAIVLQAGRAICSLLIPLRGRHHRSAFINSTGFGGYSKAFIPCRTEFDWLSKNEESIDHYIADPLCGFCFTVSGFRDMFKGMLYIGRQKNISQAEKSLPCLFISGNRDPVGECGKGVNKIADMFRKTGINSVEVRLYENDRHEVLNETDRENAYADVCAFISKHISAVE